MRIERELPPDTRRLLKPRTKTHEAVRLGDNVRTRSREAPCNYTRNYMLTRTRPLTCVVSSRGGCFWRSALPTAISDRASRRSVSVLVASTGRRLVAVPPPPRKHRPTARRKWEHDDDACLSRFDSGTKLDVPSFPAVSSAPPVAPDRPRVVAPFSSW